MHLTEKLVNYNSGKNIVKFLDLAKMSSPEYHFLRNYG